MKAIATFLRWFFLISNFVIIICIGSTESRYLKSAENINELSYENAKALDDDVDLENVVEDYYDDLWHYLEIASDLGSEKKSKEKFKTEDNRDKQLNLADYDYMSDMAVPEPTNDEKKFKVSGFLNFDISKCKT